MNRIELTGAELTGTELTGTPAHRSRNPGLPGRVAGRRLHHERGVVTVELVFGILIVIMVTALFGWAILLFGAQISAVSTAEDVARQAARGDKPGVAQARKHAPQNASIRMHTSGPDVRVTVDVDARPAGTAPTIPLHAVAVAQKEPGEPGSR